MSSTQTRADELREAKHPVYSDRALRLGTFGTNLQQGAAITSIDGHLEANWPSTLELAQIGDRMGFEALVSVVDQLQEIVVAGRRDAAVGSDADARPTAALVPQEPHAAASISKLEPSMTSVSPTLGATAFRFPVVSYFGTSERKRSTSSSASR